jgi:hypothetical protein
MYQPRNKALAITMSQEYEKCHICREMHDTEYMVAWPKYEGQHPICYSCVAGEAMEYALIHGYEPGTTQKDWDLKTIDYDLRKVHEQFNGVHCH